jgi:ABC-2 type transport system ATP-binding protein
MPPSNLIVEAKDIVVRFGDVVALDSVSLAFERGIVYGLLGPNGAGKTTLIRVLATLLKPQSGSARVAGVDVIHDATRARAHIGLAGQFAAVDEYQTGRENVEMVGRLYGLSGSETRRQTEDVLTRIGLIEAADRRVGTYSGGMRRRLDLAASLVGRPEIMFLDEPTTGIDPRSRVEVWNLIRDLVDAGTTVLLTTQYLEEADRLAARIAVIHLGHIIQEGTADELKDALGGAVLEVVVDPDRRAEAIELMAGATGEEAQFDERHGRIRIPARDGSRTLARVARALDDAGIESTDIGIHKPTLDDVFLALTDDAPEDETEPNPGHDGGRRSRRREKGSK